MKSSFANFSSESSDILSTTVLHKHRPQKKRVRFAVKLEPVDEDSLSSSRDTSASMVSKSSNRVIDPWRQRSALYGAYVEYLEKQDALISNESRIHPTRPPPPPPAPEPGTEPPTYTHTFVIQSKSPEIVVDSITVSSPSFHLPRIRHQPKRPTKHQSLTFDSYVKQQLTFSSSPRITHSKRPFNASNAKPHYTPVHAALKRAELALPPTDGLHANNKITRAENLFGSKFINDSMQSRKITEVITKPLPGINTQINHFSDRSILPNYSKKSRMHNRIQHPNEELNTNTPYFFQNHGNDHLPRPIIHSNR